MRGNTLTGLVLDAKLVRHKDGFHVRSQDGPEDGHRRADGRDVHLQDHEQDGLGAVPCRVAGGVPAAAVVDCFVDAPDGEGDDTVLLVNITPTHTHTHTHSLREAGEKGDEKKGG